MQEKKEAKNAIRDEIIKTHTHDIIDCKDFVERELQSIYNGNIENHCCIFIEYESVSSFSIRKKYSKYFNNFLLQVLIDNHGSRWSGTE
jgi:hypothetical protein